MTFLGVLASAMLTFAGTALSVSAQAPGKVRWVPPAERLLDGGGFPTVTPTETPLPTLTPTIPPPAAPYPAPSPTLIAFVPQEAFIPAAEAQQAESAGRSSPSIGLLCLPFGVALAIVVTILATYLRRRARL
jgi:hypothetical protein